jgi:hypothetical protein
MRELRKITGSTARQPRKAPSIPKNLMSPPPMPSFLVSSSYPAATAKRLPPPRRMPKRESVQDIHGRAKEQRNPTRIPGRLMTSGMI